MGRAGIFGRRAGKHDLIVQTKFTSTKAQTRQLRLSPPNVNTFQSEQCGENLDFIFH
jgi:hypothetical protein